MLVFKHVIPWGRSFDEYRRMFALSDDDLQKRIVGCGDGPAAFNAEATRRGMRVVSCDPLYEFEAAQIRERIEATYDDVLEQTRRKHDAFVWREIRDPEDLGRVRMAAMETFLADYDAGKQDGRYMNAALPHLPFPDDSFDLALCSHFLFLYTTHFSESFHQQAVAEMCRVAREVRIFPLLTLEGIESPYLGAVCEAAARAGWQARVEPARYEFQLGGNKLLRIVR